METLPSLACEPGPDVRGASPARPLVPGEPPGDPDGPPDLSVTIRPLGPSFLEREPAAAPDDRTVVLRVLAGDTEAFGSLVARYRPEFAGYATSLCGDADTAADALQDAFIRAFDALSSCNPARFRPWFFRILTNRCYDLRAAQRAYLPLDELPGPPGDEPDGRLARAEIGQAFTTALAALTRVQQEAFALTQIDGYSYAEAAVLLDAPVDALKMRVHRARTKLRQQLKAFR